MRTVAFSIAAIALFAGTAYADDAAPRITTGNVVFNFGEVENTGPVKYRFELQNEGNATLEIEAVRPACGCTVADLKDDTLAPGDSTVIEGTVDLPGRHGDIAKTLTVLSNDPQQPALQLKIEGKLLRRIYFEPEAISFPKLGINEETSATITLKTDHEDSAFSISEVSLIDNVTNTPAEYFELTQETVTEGKEYLLTVTTKPPLPNRSIRAQLTAKTDKAGYEELSTYVVCTPVGPYFVSPQTLMLPEPRGNAAGTARRILVRAGLVEEFDVVRVEFPNDDADVSFTHKPEVGFLIDLKGLIVTEELDGKEVIIKTDNEEHPEIRVPIRIMRPQSVPRRPAPTQ